MTSLTVNRWVKHATRWLRNSLQHRFVWVDIHQQSPQHLAKLDNLVALIMRLELPHQSAEVAHVLLQLNEKLAIQDPLRELIRTWVLARVSDSSSISHPLDAFVNAKGTAMSVNENFQNFFRDLTQTAHAKGQKVGRAEGRMEGRIEGQSTLLSHLLARRFGPLDDATQSRLMSANPRQMKQWAERILTATRLEDVFKSRH